MRKRLSFIGLAVSLTGLAMVAGPGRALAARPLGIDVSSYQGTGINWTSVKNSGVSFAWAKASEGTSGSDTTFTINEGNGKAAGVYIGAYHFAHPELNTPSAEATWFWSKAGNYIKADGKSLMPVLDLEVVGSTGASSVADWVNQWCNAVKAKAAAADVTVKPVVYTGISLAQNYLDSTVTQWPLWMSWPSTLDPQTGAPYQTTPWSTWNAWQYSWTGTVPGVSGDCDMDVFNGTAAQLVSTLVIAGATPPPTNPPVITGLGLFDLGTAGTNDLSNTHGVRLPCKVDVSKDGLLVGATDGNTNAFFWTPANGKVALGSSMSLAGVDWLSNQVLVVVNTNAGSYPARWLGTANGAGGSWATLPAANGTAGSGGYWKATSLAVAADSSNWWLAGYTSGGTQTGMLRYKYTSASATSIGLPTSGHANSYFWAAADAGEFAGTAEYGGSGSPGGGSVNGVNYLANPSTWLGPPEAGSGTAVSTSYTCIANAISGDGTVAGGADKNAVPKQALYWDNGGAVHQLPLLLISGTTYADWMEVHSLNKDGTIMGGVYYTNPPTDSGYAAFVYYRNSNAVFKVSSLLAAAGASTNGWTFNDVTAISDDGNTLVGWGITNGQRHAWVALRLTVGSVAVTNVTCNGSANGTITVTTFGGGLPLQYSKDNGVTWQTNNPTFTALASGSYTIKVRDTNGFTATYSNNPVTLTQPSAVTIGAVTPVNVTCNGGNNGSLAVTASGGTGALQFSDNGGTSWNAGTSPYTFNSLTAGTYNLRVKDANGCTAIYGSNPVSLTQPSAVTISAVTPINVTCNGGNNGSITVTASGGTGALQFSDNGGTSWTAGTSPYTFSSLVAGSHSVKVRDASLCTVTYGSVPITQPSVLIASAAPDTTIAAGVGYSLNGSASGGNGGYAYSWSPATGLDAANIAKPTASPTSTTLYTLTVTDSLACTAQTQVNVTVNDAPVLGAALSGPNLILSWPALPAFAGYALQQNSDLAITNWTAVTTEPVSDGTTITVTLPASTGNQFYRLQK